MIVWIKMILDMSHSKGMVMLSIKVSLFLFLKLVSYTNVSWLFWQCSATTLSHRAHKWSKTMNRCLMVAVIVWTNLGVICSFPDSSLRFLPHFLNKPLYRYVAMLSTLQHRSDVHRTKHDSQWRGNTTLLHNRVLSGVRTERMQSALP